MSVHNKKFFLLIVAITILSSVGSIYFMQHMLRDDFVGSIKNSKTIEKSDFHLCGGGYVYQYYHSNTSYNGGRKAIREKLLPKLSAIELGRSINGFITIRFIVNCKGETGRFEVLAIDKNLNTTIFTPAFLDILLHQVSSLSDWLSGKIDGNTVDSFYQMTFKIVAGKIIEIY